MRPRMKVADGCMSFSEPGWGSIVKAMETVEGTELPLEAGREERVSLRPPASDPTTPMAKLAEADRHLLAIGAEVATLREELARLREEAGERAELLSEREMVIAELSGLLPTLEEARVSAVRQAEGASAALTRSEARLAEQAGRFAELERQLATVDATNAAHQQVVAELEARLEAERTKREGSERALVAAQAHTQSVERSLAEARSRLESLSGDHERLLAERAEERAQAQRQADTLEAALSRRVAGLSELEASLARVRSEHEEVKAVAPERPYLVKDSSSLTHLRFVLRAGGYTVTQSEGEPPEIGQLVELDGERFVVAKTGPSPFPYDRRPCAYLLVDVGPTVEIGPPVEVGPPVDVVPDLPG